MTIIMVIIIVKMMIMVMIIVMVMIIILVIIMVKIMIMTKVMIIIMITAYSLNAMSVYEMLHKNTLPLDSRSNIHSSGLCYTGNALFKIQFVT